MQLYRLKQVSSAHRLSRSLLAVEPIAALHFRAPRQTQMAESEASSRRFRIYTKTGDRGSSSLYNGERRPKHNEFFMALGDVDELNGVIGLAREYALQSVVGIEEQLVEIQSRLIDVGSAIATPAKTSRPEQVERHAFPTSHTQQLEQWIDGMDEHLPPLKNFILPSGGLAASQLHVARTVCRRAERQAWQLVTDGQLSESVAVYLNRLSDYLFMAARFAAMKSKKTEQVYKKVVGLTERQLGEAAEAGTASAAATEPTAAAGSAGTDNTTSSSGGPSSSP